MVSQNRNAILDLHNLVNNVIKPPDKSATAENPSMAREHHRQLSEVTGIDISPIPDVLPLPNFHKQHDTRKVCLDNSPETVHRTFSKRGVRLGVHMSILDLHAHDAPDSLKKKWIQQANRRRPSIHEHNHSAQHHNGGRLTALPELSRISEVNTSAASMSGSGNALSAARSEMIDHVAPEPTYDTMQTPMKEVGVPLNTPVECGSSLQKVNDKIGNKLRRVVSNLSMASLRTPSKAQE